MASIDIVSFDPAAGKDILADVHGLHFTGKDSSAKRVAYADWLVSNPVPDSIYLAAHVDGQFASFLGFMAREAVGLGRSFKVALAFGAMTRPEFAGRGLYKKLAYHGWDEAVRRGFSFCAGYTIRPYVLEMEKRMGWDAIVASPVMALPLDVRGVLGKMLPAAAAPLSHLAAPANWLARRRIATRVRGMSTPTGYSIVRARTFSERYDQLNTQLMQGNRVTFAKNSAALNWLYLSVHNPFSYQIAEAHHAGELVGFAVGRHMDMMGFDGYGLLDLVALPGHERVLAPLAAELIGSALAARPQVVGALVSAGTPAQAALQELGLVDSRKRFTLIARQSEANVPSSLWDGANWDNCWGNNDTV